MRLISKKYYFLILLFILIAAIFFHYISSCKYEYFTSNTSKEIVIARYNEKLEWIEEDPFNQYDLIVYNKGKDDDFKKTDKIKKIIKLDNVGKCDHTYLYHIIHNYDNLKDITIFLPGSCNMDNKIAKTRKLLKEIEAKNTAIFLSDNKFNNLHTQMYDFHLNEWSTSNAQNRAINSETTLKKSEYRPFGLWFKKYFGNTIVNNVTYMGIFSISKNDILQKPKDYYENLIQQLSDHSNPEEGHYFERAWEAVFYPLTTTIVI